MRFFILLFLLGTACAKPVYDALDNEAEVARDILADLELTPNLKEYLTLAADEEDEENTKTELGKKLQETFDHILEKIKEAIEQGKTVKEEYLQKVKEIREKLKELKIDVGKKAKELLEKLKEKARDYLKNLLEKLGLKDSDKQKRNDEEPQTELGKKLRDNLDKVLEQIKDAIDHGKTVKEETLEKLKEIRQKLKDLKVDIGEKAKELIEKLKEKAKDFWKNLLEKLGFETSEKQKRNDEEPDTDTTEQLRNRLDELLEKIKDSIDHGKTVKEDVLEKVKELRQKFKDLKVDIGEKAKELLEKVKEKAKDYWNKLLEKLTWDSSEKQKRDDEEPETELVKKLREAVDHILEHIKDAIDHGKKVKEEYLEKLKDLREKLKEHKIQIGNKAKELLEKIKEKAKNFLKDLLEKLGLKDDSDKQKRDDEDPQTELVKKLKENFEQILEKIKDGIDHGKVVKEEYLEKLKEIGQKLKDLKIDIGEKLKEKIETLKEKAKDYWKKILEKLGIDSSDKQKRAEEDLESTRLQDKLNGLFEKVKDALDRGRLVGLDVLEKIKECLLEMKEKGVGFGEKTRELFRKIREKSKGILRNFLDTLGIKDEHKRAFGKIREMFQQLKDMVLKNLDPEELKAKVEKLFGKGSELADQIFTLLKDKGGKGKQTILDWIDRVLGEKEEKRSLKELWEKTKTWFHKIGLEIQEKFGKAGAWIKEHLEEKLEKLKEKKDKLKLIAEEYIEHAKFLSKDIAREMQEFLEKFHEEITVDLWNHVKEMVKERLKMEE